MGPGVGHGFVHEADHGVSHEVGHRPCTTLSDTNSNATIYLTFIFQICYSMLSQHVTYVDIQCLWVLSRLILSYYA